MKNKHLHYTVCETHYWVQSKTRWILGYSLICVDHKINQTLKFVSMQANNLCSRFEMMHSYIEHTNTH